MAPNIITASISPARSLPHIDTPAYARESVGYGIFPVKTISTNSSKTNNITIEKYDLFRNFHLDNIAAEVYKIFHEEYFKNLEKEVVK